EADELQHSPAPERHDPEHRQDRQEDVCDRLLRDVRRVRSGRVDRRSEAGHGQERVGHLGHLPGVIWLTSHRSAYSASSSRYGWTKLAPVALTTQRTPATATLRSDGPSATDRLVSSARSTAPPNPRKCTPGAE